MEDSSSPLQRWRLHAQMYTHGRSARHGSEEQRASTCPIATGELRLQAFGVTEPTSGTDTTALRTFAKKEGDRYIVNGQKIWTSRAEHSDLMLLLARTTPKDQARKKTEGLSTFLVDMKAALGKGLTIRPIRTMMNHNSCEVFFDNMEVPAENLVGEKARASANPVRHEPERILTLRVHRRRQVVHNKASNYAKSARCSAGRSPEPGPSSSRSPRPTPTCAPPN